MKKSLITGVLGIAFAFAMVACGGNAATEDTAVVDEAAEMAEEHCMHHCQMTCPDSVCLAANCENCACPDSSACKQKPHCMKAEGEKCCKENAEGCKKAEGEKCCKEKAEGEKCCKNKQNGECKKECEKKQ